MKTSISGYTKLAGVIAKPIKHSLSPIIHNKAYEVANIDAVYLAFDVEERAFNNVLQSVLNMDMLGVNISMPYKRLAYEACDEISSEAQLIGVVNTVVPKNGSLVGFNTDGIGFVDSLSSQAVDVKGKRIMVLGAGGAAKAIICQCALEQASEIVVFKRNNSSFESISKELEEISKKTNLSIKVVDYANQKLMAKEIKKSQIIVNATQIGMGEDTQIPVHSMEGINQNHVLVDLIYHPLETEFLKQGKEKQATVINGLGMLVYQAAYAFKLMTGKEMPVKQIEEMLLDKWR